MLAAGIPLVQAFEIVGNGNDKPAMQRLILDIKADVEGGTSLHEALGKHPLFFDDLYVNLVEAGEQAGALETLLDKIATYKEKTEALKKKVKKAAKHHKATAKLHKRLKKAKKKAASATKTIHSATAGLMTAQRNVTTSC